MSASRADSRPFPGTPIGYKQLNTDKLLQVHQPTLRRQKILISVKCRDLIQLDWISVCNPVLCLFKIDSETGALNLIDKTEWVAETHNPTFQKHFLINHFPSKAQRLVCRVYDVDRFNSEISHKDFVAECDVHLDSVVPSAHLTREVTLPLRNPQSQQVDKLLRKVGSVCILGIRRLRRTSLHMEFSVGYKLIPVPSEQSKHRLVQRSFTCDRCRLGLRRQAQTRYLRNRAGEQKQDAPQSDSDDGTSLTSPMLQSIAAVDVTGEDLVCALSVRAPPAASSGDHKTQHTSPGGFQYCQRSEPQPFWRTTLVSPAFLESVAYPGPRGKRQDRYRRVKTLARRLVEQGSLSEHRYQCLECGREADVLAAHPWLGSMRMRLGQHQRAKKWHRQIGLLSDLHFTRRFCVRYNEVADHGTSFRVSLLRAGVRATRSVRGGTRLRDDELRADDVLGYCEFSPYEMSLTPGVDFTFPLLTDDYIVLPGPASDQAAAFTKQGFVPRSVVSRSAGTFARDAYAAAVVLLRAQQISAAKDEGTAVLVSPRDQDGASSGSEGGAEDESEGEGDGAGRLRTRLSGLRWVGGRAHRCVCVVTCRVIREIADESLSAGTALSETEGTGQGTHSSGQTRSANSTTAVPTLQSIARKVPFLRYDNAEVSLVSSPSTGPQASPSATPASGLDELELVAAQLQDQMGLSPTTPSLPSDSARSRQRKATPALPALYPAPRDSAQTVLASLLEFLAMGRQFAVLHADQPPTLCSLAYRRTVPLRTMSLVELRAATGSGAGSSARGRRARVSLRGGMSASVGGSAEYRTVIDPSCVSRAPIAHLSAASVGSGSSGPAQRTSIFRSAGGVRADSGGGHGGARGGCAASSGSPSETLGSSTYMGAGASRSAAPWDSLLHVLGGGQAEVLAQHVGCVLWHGVRVGSAVERIRRLEAMLRPGSRLRNHRSTRSRQQTRAGWTEGGNGEDSDFQAVTGKAEMVRKAAVGRTGAVSQLLGRYGIGPLHMLPLASLTDVYLGRQTSIFSSPFLQDAQYLSPERVGLPLSVAMRRASQEHRDHPQRAGVGFDQLCFSLVAPHCALHLCAPSQAVRDAWVHGLLAALQAIIGPKKMRVRVHPVPRVNDLAPFLMPIDQLNHENRLDTPDKEQFNTPQVTATLQQQLGTAQADGSEDPSVRLLDSDDLPWLVGATGSENRQGQPETQAGGTSHKDGPGSGGASHTHTHKDGCVYGLSYALSASEPYVLRASALSPGLLVRLLQHFQTGASFLEHVFHFPPRLIQLCYYGTADLRSLGKVRRRVQRLLDKQPTVRPVVPVETSDPQDPNQTDLRWGGGDKPHTIPAGVVKGPALTWYEPAAGDDFILHPDHRIPILDVTDLYFGKQEFAVLRESGYAARVPCANLLSLSLPGRVIHLEASSPRQRTVLALVILGLAEACGVMVRVHLDANERPEEEQRARDVLARYRRLHSRSSEVDDRRRQALAPREKASPSPSLSRSSVGSGRRLHLGVLGKVAKGWRGAGGVQTPWSSRATSRSTSDVEIRTPNVMPSVRQPAYKIEVSVACRNIVQWRPSVKNARSFLAVCMFAHNLDTFELTYIDQTELVIHRPDPSFERTFAWDYDPKRPQLNAVRLNIYNIPEGAREIVDEYRIGTVVVPFSQLVKRVGTPVAFQMHSDDPVLQARLTEASSVCVVTCVRRVVPSSFTTHTKEMAGGVAISTSERKTPRKPQRWDTVEGSGEDGGVSSGGGRLLSDMQRELRQSFTQGAMFKVHSSGDKAGRDRFVSLAEDVRYRLGVIQVAHALERDQLDPERYPMECLTRVFVGVHFPVFRPQDDRSLCVSLEFNTEDGTQVLHLRAEKEAVRNVWAFGALAYVQPAGIDAQILY